MIRLSLSLYMLPHSHANKAAHSAATMVTLREKKKKKRKRQAGLKEIVVRTCPLTSVHARTHGRPRSAPFVSSFFFFMHYIFQF